MLCHTMAKMGLQGSRDVPHMQQDVGCGVLGMSPLSHGKQGSGDVPPGTSPLSPGTAGSRGVPTKTWDMGQWEHNPGSRDMEQQRCHSPTSNRTWDSGDILTEPCNIKQQGCPHQAMGCGTKRMSLSHGTWGSRDVHTDLWDTDVHTKSQDVGQWGHVPELWGRGMFPFTPGLCMEVNGAQHPPCHAGLSTIEPHALPTQWPHGFPCNRENPLPPCPALLCPGGPWPQLGHAELDVAP